MPRKNPLPDTEAAVGRRLERARKEALIPRAALAVKLGVSTNRLYSYEAGMAKLPWGVADRACQILDINPAWLAGRAETLGVYVEHQLPAASAEKKAAAPFTEIYDGFYRPESARAATDARAKVSRVMRDMEAAVERAAAAGAHPTETDRKKLLEIKAHVEQLLARIERVPKKEKR